MVSTLVLMRSSRAFADECAELDEARLQFRAEVRARQALELLEQQRQEERRSCAKKALEEIFQGIDEADERRAALTRREDAAQERVASLEQQLQARERAVRDREKSLSE